MQTETAEIAVEADLKDYRSGPTVWGLDPVQLHDRFWAARGVQVVRQGERYEIVKHAELFLLTDPRTLAIFSLSKVVQQFSWTPLDLLTIRLHNTREAHYRERVLSNADGRFLRYVRIYGSSDSRLARVAFTTDPDVAQQWQNAEDVRSTWRRLRRDVLPRYRSTLTLNGKAYDRGSSEEINEFMRDLVRVWKRPDATIPEVKRMNENVWGLRELKVGPDTTVIGGVWLGAGRHVDDEAGVLGPAVLWDNAAERPKLGEVEWQEIERKDILARDADSAEVDSVSSNEALL